MKLDPVYVLAPVPKPQPAVVPTRRAMLFAGAAFAFGAGGGLLSARWLAPAAAPAPTPSPALDPRLVWMQQQCADTTPLPSLLRNVPALLQILAQHPDDQQLWHGVDRIAAALISDQTLADRRLLAQQLLAVAATHAPGHHGNADLLVAQLREIARGR